MAMHCASSRSIGRVCTGYSLSSGLTAPLTIATCCMCCAHNEHPCLALGMGSSKACQVSRYIVCACACLCVCVCVCVCVCTSAGPIFINCVVLALDMFGLYPTLQASFTRLFSVDTGACSVLFCSFLLCSVVLCLPAYSTRFIIYLLSNALVLQLHFKTCP